MMGVDWNDATMPDGDNCLPDARCLEREELRLSKSVLIADSTQLVSIHSSYILAYILLVP